VFWHPLPEMKKAGVRIPGIGHRIKSAHNQDKRVVLMRDYAEKHFPSTNYFQYAQKVFFFVSKEIFTYLWLQRWKLSPFKRQLTWFWMLTVASEPCSWILWRAALASLPKRFKKLWKLDTSTVSSFLLEGLDALVWLVFVTLTQCCCSIGLIGHALDQKRLKQPLYRHPWDDVLYG